jgi:hypothetical protein
MFRFNHHHQGAYYLSFAKVIVIKIVVPCILMLSMSFIYQLMHNRVALKEY